MNGADQSELGALVRQYAEAIDRRDPDRLLATFAPGGVLQTLWPNVSRPPDVLPERDELARVP